MHGVKRRPVPWEDYLRDIPSGVHRQPNAIFEEAELPKANFSRCREIPEGSQCTEPFSRSTVSARPIMRPDISAGLGKRRDKRDLVQLTRYMRRELTLMVNQGKLCCYDEPCWRRLSQQQAEARILSVLSDSGLDDCITERECEEIYRRILLDETLVVEGELSPSAWKLNLSDGTLDLITHELTRPNPEDHFFRYVDISYRELADPNLQGSTFENFVKNLSAGNPLVRRQLLELVALAILGYPIKNFFVMLGPSHTGKTQFGRFLAELIGRDFVMTVRDASDFGDRFTSGSLIDKVLVTCLDLPNGPLPPAAVASIKQLVGDDPIKAEVKYHDPVTIYKKPLLLLAGNYPIQLPRMGEEQALLNRMVAIPFLNPVPEQEMRQQFFQNLLDEAPYIVREALVAFRALVERNFQVTRTELPPQYAPQDSRAGYQAVKEFIHTHCIPQPGACVATHTLFEGFSQWGDVPLTEIDFSRCLSEVLANAEGITAEKRVGPSQRRGYRGLALLP